MTFAEYNTDENYDNDKSSLDELVKIGLSEGKSGEDIKNSLSPKWKKSKKIGEFDNYVKQYSTAPKSEEKETVKETVTQTPTKTKADTFIEKQNEIADKAEENELKKQPGNMLQRWDNYLLNAQNMAGAMRNVDDKMVNQLPTFISRRFANGEFGDPKTKDAKLRLAYFMINGLQNTLKVTSNALMQRSGRAPLFSDTTSDYDKYQETNLAKGLENRWNKYKQETDAALELAKQRGMSEEAITDTSATLASNARLQNAVNMMNEEQKVWTFNVLSELGNNLGNMNNKEFVNTLMGMSAMGESLDPKEAAAMIVYRFGKDPDKVKDFIRGLGFDVDGIKDAIGNGETKTAGASGNNLKGYQTIDGETVDFNMIESKEGKAKLRNLMDDLSKRYYNEEIDEETFRKYYEPLYLESRKHVNTGSNSTQQMIDLNKRNHRTEINTALNELQDKAKQGVISPSDYKEQFDNIVANFKKWGLDASNLAKVEKSRISQEKILKNVEKANKKKK